MVSFPGVQLLSGVPHIWKGGPSGPGLNLEFRVQN
jgi:hypothetical protein